MEELTAVCPACGEEILLDFTPEIGETISCPQCNTSSEIIRKNPLTLVAIEDNNEDFLKEEPGDSKEDMF
ncbi:MAG: lysine biosynthesis protein LysW [Candidatus Kaelpia imicola]|nr:lysine biosynthesis protein LysW [Candidatus Kaelpia imicola]